MKNNKYIFKIKKNTEISDDVTIAPPLPIGDAKRDLEQTQVQVLRTSNGTAKVLVSSSASKTNSVEFPKETLPPEDTNGLTTSSSQERSGDVLPSTDAFSKLQPQLPDVASKAPTIASPKPALLPKPAVKPPVPPKSLIAAKPTNGFQGPPQQATSR